MGKYVDISSTYLDNGKKAKPVTNKMKSSACYSIECSCGGDCVSADCGSYMINEEHNAICEECGQRWYFKSNIRTKQ